METLQFSRIFNFDSYLEFLQRVQSLEDPDELTVDLSKAYFLHASGMAPLIAMIRFLYQAGWQVHVVCPQGNDRYFDMAGWGPAIEGKPADPARAGATYVPLTSYSAHEELNALIGRVMDCLRRQSVYKQGVLDAVEWTVNEIADNVLLHAGGVGGWLQATSRPANSEIEIVVADCGRGIASSLNEAFPGLHDLEALQAGVTRGITRSQDVGQGNGLAGTVRIATAARAWANLHSGSALMRLRGDGTQQWTPHAPHHQGVVVTLTLPTSTSIDVGNALWGTAPEANFRRVDDDIEGDPEFVVNQHATGFGNRASAKPLRVALENMLTQLPQDRIVVSFRGIRVIAASFADEFLGRLAADREDYFDRVQIADASPLVSSTIRSVVAQRLGRRRPSGPAPR